MLEAYQTLIDSGDLQIDAEQRRAVEALSQLQTTILQKKGFFARFQKNESEKRGVYLYGGVGRGKSMLMALFFDALPDTIKKRRIHFHEFMIETHNYLHEKRSGGNIGQGMEALLPTYARHIASQTRVLCFDEFHVTDVADAMILSRLFTAMFDAGVYIVTTSNWEPNRLYEGGLQRELFIPFIDVIKDKMAVVHLDSPTDYREAMDSDNAHYFTPVNDVTRTKMNVIFDVLTDGDHTKASAIKVKGRTFKPIKSQGKTAWFSFAQLCEQPMGAEDYLAIARTFDSVFLEGVRKMGYDRRNEAKRFMLLIDALYDEGVTLYVQAEVDQGHLYTGHDHAFEFDRTLSRLREMT